MCVWSAPSASSLLVNRLRCWSTVFVLSSLMLSSSSSSSPPPSNSSSFFYYYLCVDRAVVSLRCRGRWHHTFPRHCSPWLAWTPPSIGPAHRSLVKTGSACVWLFGLTLLPGVLASVLRATCHLRHQRPQRHQQHQQHQHHYAAPATRRPLTPPHPPSPPRIPPPRPHPTPPITTTTAAISFLCCAAATAFYMPIDDETKGYVIIASICASRTWLWTFDLAHMQVLQEGTEPNVRGRRRLCRCSHRCRRRRCRCRLRCRRRRRRRRRRRLHVCALAGFLSFLLLCMRVDVCAPTATAGYARHDVIYNIPGLE